MVGVSAPLVRGRVYTGYAMLCYTLFNTAFPYTLQKDHSDGDRDSLIQIRIKHFAKSKSGKGNNNLFHLSKFKNWKFNFFIYKRTKNRYLYVCDSHKKHIFIFNTLQNMYEQKKRFFEFFLQHFTHVHPYCMPNLILHNYFQNSEYIFFLIISRSQLTLNYISIGAA